MASSSTGDRSRWGTTRRSGMTILGKVAVPKPINLPSQRLENQGLDPNVEIVPKGTLSWGSKSSLNAWGTSSLSPRTESGPGSPSHLSNRPSSGGSVTRPSTADSDKAHDSSSIGWDSNSRPSSASGVFPTNQASVALQRPHSADTRPGSSQLSRFAEAVSETSATWGQHGVDPAKKDGFSLTSGDFPSLGAEKESSEKTAMPQDARPGTRPASSSGRSVEERGVDCTEEANVRIGDDNEWGRDNQPYSEDARRHYREEGQLDSRGSHSYHASFPHQYDTWRGPPVNNHQGGGWYRGNQPYGAPMGPGGFHVDPFPFYPAQVPPIPGHEAGPRGNNATNGKMFRPPVLDPYAHPRPGFFLGPVPHEGYYGPPRGYGGPSNRDLPFAGRPAGPHAYHQHSGRGGYDTSASSVALERNEPSHSQERQYKILLKPQDERFKEDEAKREEFLGNRLPNAEEVAPQMQTSKNNRRVNNNETSGEVQPIKAETAAREDPSLIQKIEGLNAKTAFNSGTSANQVSARMPRSGHAGDSKNSLHYKQGDPATNKNAELAASSGTTISSTYRRSTQQTQGGADHEAKQRVNSEGNDGWRKTAVMSGSSAVILAPNSERRAQVNVGDSPESDSIGKLGSGISVEPNDNQHTTMRELARQRAQQRQKEEEERERHQRAKALAKLEELNRRSQLAEEGSVKNVEAAHNASTPDMPEVPPSRSPARMASKSDDVHTRTSREKNTTVTAAEPIEATEVSGKMLLQDGPTQHDNFPRHREGATSKQKRLGYKQRQNIVFEKKLAGSSFSEATTEVVDVVPSPEVSKEGVLGHNADMPAVSSVSTESTFTKRKSNRNGKKKHKVEETTAMNPTRAGVEKETKSGDESIEIGRARLAEMELGSVSVPSLDIKVSGHSSDQISSFTNEESQSKVKNNWKSQNLRRNPRNSVANKPSEKFPGSNTVIWAPVHPQQKADITTGVGSQNTVPEFSTSSKNLHQGQTSSKSKRVEMERYVAKPIVKEMAEQVVGKNPTTDAPEKTENVLQKDGGEDTGLLQPSGSPSKSRHGNVRQGKHGRDQGSWHQRGSAASTKALEEGQFVTPNQPIRGTVNYNTSNQTEHIAAGSSKDQTTCNAHGWNDGWYRTPETHYSAAEEAEANAQTITVGRDQGTNIHGKQHASRSNKDGGRNYNDPKKANKRDYSKAHMQQYQQDLPVASKESRGPEDHVSQHTGVTPNVNRGGKHHHHQRATSNRDRQKQNLHYEYKPVGSRTHD